MTLPEFFLGLSAMYSSSLPGKSALAYMRRRLDAEGLSPSAIQRLYDRIQDKCQYHPIWENLNSMILELSLRTVRERVYHHYIAFSLNEREYVIPIRDPSQADYSRVPGSAYRVRLIVDGPIEGYEGMPDVSLPDPEPVGARESTISSDTMVLDIVDSVSDALSGRLTRVQDNLDWEDI